MASANEILWSETVGERQAAAYLGITGPCLRAWRTRVPPVGPGALVIGREVRYRIAELRTFRETTPTHRTPKNFLRYDIEIAPLLLPDINLLETLCGKVSPARSGAEEREKQ